MRARIAAVALVLLSSVVVAGTASRAAVPASAVVYLAGDSITDGRYAPDGVYAWWRDGYAVRARDRVCGSWCGDQVVKVAHGGGCLVAAGCAYPTPAVQWVPTEVFDADPRPSTVVLQVGLNDLGLVSDQQMMDAYAQLYFAARDRGIRLITGTVNPTCANRPGWSTWEPQRGRINAWIRNNLSPDVVDFDAVLRTGSGGLDPAYAFNRCLPGTDFIHPGVLGSLRMADMVPLDRIA